MPKLQGESCYWLLVIGYWLIEIKRPKPKNDPGCARGTVEL